MLDARAVYLSHDGTGQALIYPYYTARSSNGNPFNTYVAIVNNASDAKALRVRLREASDGRIVGSFNVFLAPGDAWTAAIVPSGAEAQIATSDRSCVSPQFVSDSATAPAMPLADPSVPGLGLAREGWIQVLEMATLVRESAAAVANRDCRALENPDLQTAAPTGGLSGNLTLINVASGVDFAMGAEALVDLASAAYFRRAGDEYPDFNAAEIPPVSVVVANGAIYRSTWLRPQDAVSAVFMRRSFAGEFALDPELDAKTDFVVTYPTRQHFITGTPGAAPPFSNVCKEDPSSGERVVVTARNREQSATVLNQGAPTVFRCRAVATFDVRSPTQVVGATSVLGSQSFALVLPAIPPPTINGWLHFDFLSTRTLTSEPSSTRTVIDTGSVLVGSHVYSGLPMTGFTVSTLSNGTLQCSVGRCQGNYGGNVPLKFSRSISP